MKIAPKIWFILYNFTGAVIVSLIFIAMLPTIIGEDLELVEIVFLFDSNYAFLMLPIFGIIFAVIWSNMIFDKFIDGKELPNAMCIFIGFMIGLFSYLCATGIYIFLYVSLSMNITDISIHDLGQYLEEFFIYWFGYLLFGMIFLGIFIFVISISTIFLWRHRYHNNTDS